ncbi:hypothetical protein [Candidatus Xianfuyuplasma coldseepsis]|uniref:Uncharacterized protein n=1 Tax=Candidatus Xianfuyuplasma coldseepsis TaxID=2782163 RepID=A0A7L7KTC3_9MOLU|nr:hypothetical protein [Xianfuyuplasma coldseepsis]QMS84998.1 hypothetical protein G4Z02_04255 [Xianfuyuplasma coldseepsis]
MLPLDEFVLKDYASWKIENHVIIDTFRNNHNKIYERLEPVYLVLEHIYDMAVNQQDIDGDLETIFNIGFQYLHAQFNVMKIYFESLFQSNCEDFEEYHEMLLYLMYIFDVRTDLENHDVDSDIEALNHVETYIENMIMERRDDYAYVREMMNDALKTVFDMIEYEYVSIIDIYVEIAENLDIFIYEEDELVIGKEV